MDITPFVGTLRQNLLQAAGVGGPEARAAAERLVHALEPAIRLTLFEALSQAAEEITHELPGTSVDVRLKGRDPSFVVAGSATQLPPEPPPPPTPPPTGDEAAADPEAEEGVARITLRLPESLKARAEELAASRGQSLNTWMVNAVRAAASAMNEGAWGPFFGPGAPGRNRLSNKRIQGWVR
jgi:hypothetical protein